MNAVYRMRRVDVSQVVAMLERRDLDGALRAVGLDPVVFRQFDRAFFDAFEAGAVATENMIPRVRDAQGFRTVFQFNIRNPTAEAWLREYSSTRIREVFDDQRQMIRDVLDRAMRSGLNPRAAALDLVGRLGPNGLRQGGLIGLTRAQEGWVSSYATDLAEDPIKTLTRKLRDKRFDKVIARYARDGEPIPGDLRRKIVDTFKNRALRYRAETIARKEAITALHTAQEQAIDQAIGSGAVSEATVSYTWHTANDKRVRDSHRAMDGQVRPYGESFVSGDGVELEYPGDPAAPAAEVINCRCWREPRIDFLAGIR